MKHSLPVVGALVGALLAAFGSGAQAQAPQAYSIQTMPLYPGATGTPWIEGMNSMGLVVGRTDIGNQVYATQWGVGQPAIQLGALPATQPWAMAHAVSDAGVVVGDAASGSSATHGFRWTAGGGMQDISTGWAGGADTRAMGVNTAGQIAGSVTQNNGIVAAVFQPDGTWINLGHAPGSSGSYRISLAQDISGSGWVVGSTSDATSQRAFRWNQAGGMTALQQFVAGSRDMAVAVNEMGWSAGTGWLGNSSSDARAIAWDAQGRIVPLQTSSEWLYSSAFDINAAGTIVGEATRLGGRTAFVWSEGSGMVELDSLVLGLGDMRLLEADAINEAGQIAGVAWNPLSHEVSAYLLTPTAPVPEPAPALMLAAGLAGLAWRRRSVRRA